MAVHVERLKRLVASGGLIKIEQVDENIFKVMRTGSVDAYLGHITKHELRDMFDVIGDLITYLDTSPVSEVG